ncbi:MAG: 6-carboxytetrahydropterin synthase QueD [Deltaproteobacteria bacterium]|nr:6-carboxytetrahydropterin synthase QueD [Deltaproteobacteria bacterium]MBW2594887.1 6-carboxytetrahydropterin synthase QueD [Deltaproteobacteria bacterium]MBW2650599.1 6-carboxytetrahydropterin synthase QueD [Deltaproteobacteria bacterium]
MYEITVKKTFSAAHTLDIGSEREELHGHNFKVEATVASEELNADGLVLDFRVLKKWVNEILEDLDHTFLNNLPAFKNTVPTSENIARFIYDRLEGNTSAMGLKISRIAVWESEGSKAVYTKSRSSS